LEGLAIEDVGNFNRHFVYFTAKWYILRPCGTFCGQMVYIFPVLVCMVWYGMVMVYVLKKRSMLHLISVFGESRQFSAFFVETSIIVVGEFSFMTGFCILTNAHAPEPKPETGTGNRKPETGNRKPETGNRKPETGNRKPETENGSRKFQYGFHQNVS
jgi:hypothetical protein